MLVPPEGYVQVYDSIKQDFYQSQERRVLVFVATDSCDSVCATKTLQTIFHRDSVQFSLYPVSAYSEVQRLCREVVSDPQDLQTLILVNCGATEDVAKLLDLQESVRVIVIDSHRPFHHNLNDPDNITILAFCNPADGTCDNVPEPDIFSGSDDEDDDDEAENEEGGFDDDAENDSNRPNRRQRVSPDSSHAGISRQADRRKEQRERRHQRKEYYQKGVSSGEPATCVLYKLATALRLEDNHLLWLSILGLTDHLVHQRISHELYTSWLQEFTDLVKHSNTGESYTEIVVPRPGADDIPTAITVSKPLYGKISPIDDYRFPLMRHWSLFEAMLHSPYVAVRLQTWHDKGRRLLQDMLVKMGFPAPQFRQKWTAMDPRYQKILASKLQEHAHNYTLTDVSFRSFELAWAWRKQTASDTVHAVTALLEVTTAKQAAAHDDTKDRFWRAWSALSVESANNELKQGLELSKKLQQGILNAGGLIMARGLGNQNMKRYHMWNLSHQDISNKEMMTSPTALAKLGWFLMEARQHQTNRHKDVIMVSPPNHDKMCLVLGVVAQPTLATRQGNTFGTAFRSAADDTEAQTQHDGFDSSIMRISADDVQRFVMTLHLKLSHGR
ncbi:hypothetical protein WJX77_012186 [Trebouxia sp. C0004]